MRDVLEKYLAYIAFQEQIKRLPWHDREILFPELQRLQKQWKEAFHQTRLLATRRRPP